MGLKMINVKKDTTAGTTIESESGREPVICKTWVLNVVLGVPTLHLPPKVTNNCP